MEKRPDCSFTVLEMTVREKQVSIAHTLCTAQHAPAAIWHQPIVLSETEACSPAGALGPAPVRPDSPSVSGGGAGNSQSKDSLSTVESLFHFMLILGTCIACLSKVVAPQLSVFTLPCVFKQDYLKSETWYL